MKIKAIECSFSVCQLKDISAIDMNSELFFLGKTDEELSLVCPTESIPVSVIKRDDGWKAFRIEGILDFSLIGILSKIANLLADNDISIFAISTFNTDYILTKADNYARALDLLEKAGYQIV
ncbi:MAG: ACT domain-containing protein [Oscillospiraceae bacterium]